MQLKIVLLISLASISQVKAILNCTGDSIGPCNGGLCTPIQTSGLICTTAGCCDNTQVISIETGATTFTCANDASNGPLIPGVPCPSDSVRALDSTGASLCCPLANLVSIVPTTVRTYTVKSVTSTTCVDLLNPVTGVSDCPRRSALCSDSTYYDVMRVQCPKTCNLCSSSSNTSISSSSCTDKTNAATGISDCSALRYLCTNSVYSSLMSQQCCATCGSVGK